MAIPVPYLPLRFGAVLGLALGISGYHRLDRQIGQLSMAALLALYSGVSLALLGVIRGDRIYVPHQAAIIASAILGLVGVVTLFVWCAKASSPLRTMGSFALSLLIVPLTHPDLWAANPWKFGMSWPATVLALCIAQRRGRVWTGAVLGVSGVLSAALDTRSMLIFCFFGLLILGVPLRRQKIKRRAVLGRVLLVCGAFWVVTSAGSQLAVSGLLGQEIQQKTIWQESNSGSLITSARAEIPTSIALISHQPWGYGLGVVPDTQDRLRSLAATVSYGGDESAALLGDPLVNTFRLHSQLADLWFFVGPGGFPILILIAGTLLRGLVSPPASKSVTQDSMLIFVSSFSAWDFLFSPFENNYVMTAAAMGLVLTLRSQAMSEGPSETST